MLKELNICAALATFAIRQKSTGMFIPGLEKGRRYGGSYQEPTNQRVPRLFYDSKTAKNFLVQWLLGHHKKIFEQSGEFGEDVRESITIIPQPHRKREDMEIVEFDLVEKGVVCSLNASSPSSSIGSFMTIEPGKI